MGGQKPQIFIKEMVGKSLEDLFGTNVCEDTAGATAVF